jgi:hypothetical protein
LEGRGRWISEFQASLVYRVSSCQGYTEKPCLEKPKKKKKKKKRKDHNNTDVLGKQQGHIDGVERRENGAQKRW